LNEISLNRFKNSIEGCQFDTAYAPERVWLDDPPAYSNCRYLVLISEDRLSNEIQNQLECWRSRIPQTILVCYPSHQQENEVSVLDTELIEAGVFLNLCDSLHISVHMNWNEFAFEVNDGSEVMKEVRL